jgi:hypothetical protein
MIDPAQFGVSFSLKQCRNFKLDGRETLDWLIAQGWRRFRLMSYWNEHEKQPGQYDFSQLDWQIDVVAKAGGVVTLCLGVKQPRWPEYHWPEWAWKLSKGERQTALLTYVQTVVERYKDNPVIISWQLENEALLSNFGSRIDIDRARLRAEYALVKQLDITRPIIMSTSNGWGIPLRNPRPDIVGFSCYFKRYSNGRYHSTVQPPILHRVRKQLLSAMQDRPSFIHELQCEPWGHTAIWKMTSAEQDISMNTVQIQHNIAAAKRIGAYPIDLWGAEWWYWRSKNDDPTIWHAVSESVQ